MNVEGEPLASASSQTIVASMGIAWTVFAISVNLALSSYG
jgi:hypothetical protein